MVRQFLASLVALFWGKARPFVEDEYEEYTGEVIAIPQDFELEKPLRAVEDQPRSLLASHTEAKGRMTP